MMPPGAKAVFTIVVDGGASVRLTAVLQPG